MDATLRNRGGQATEVDQSCWVRLFSIKIGAKIVGHSRSIALSAGRGRHPKSRVAEILRCAIDPRGAELEVQLDPCGVVIAPIAAVIPSTIDVGSTLLGDCLKSIR
jgi:hypothetical protein